jgi:hypothetical protein
LLTIFESRPSTAGSEATDTGTGAAPGGGGAPIQERAWVAPTGSVQEQEAVLLQAPLVGPEQEPPLVSEAEPEVLTAGWEAL